MEPGSQAGHQGPVLVVTFTSGACACVTPKSVWLSPALGQRTVNHQRLKGTPGPDIAAPTHRQRDEGPERVGSEDVVPLGRLVDEGDADRPKHREEGVAHGADPPWDAVAVENAGTELALRSRSSRLRIRWWAARSSRRQL